MTGPSAETRLLTALLEAEHAAVYGYGVLGARLGLGARRVAFTAFEAHRARRDELEGLLRSRGDEVAVTRTAYDVAAPSAAAAYALAVRVEEGLAVRWRDLVAGTDAADLRTLGVGGLTDSAVRAARWRREQGRRPATVALPGQA